MSLPKQSTWHVLKGTWFVYKGTDVTVHIRLKNNGMQNVYVNEELVSETRSLKLRTEQRFEHKGKKYLVRIAPANKAMTSFETELLLEDKILRVFAISYRLEPKNFIPFLLVIVGLTIPMVIMKLPTWTFYLMVIISAALKILVFNKDLFEITEKDIVFNTEI